MESHHEPDLELKNLNNFYGSEHYYRLMGGINATDGVHYVMQNGYSVLCNRCNRCTESTPEVETIPLTRRLRCGQTPATAKQASTDVDGRWKWTRTVQADLHVFRCEGQSRVVLHWRSVAACQRILSLGRQRSVTRWWCLSARALVITRWQTHAWFAESR